MSTKLFSIFFVALLAFSSVSFADEFEQGRVTSIDRKADTIEIDGKEYRCNRLCMRHARKGVRLKFFAEHKYKRENGKRVVEREIIEIAKE